jgi:hypothetical protein
MSVAIIRKWGARATARRHAAEALGAFVEKLIPYPHRGCGRPARGHAYYLRPPTSSLFFLRASCGECILLADVVVVDNWGYANPRCGDWLYGDLTPASRYPDYPH